MVLHKTEVHQWGNSGAMSLKSNICPQCLLGKVDVVKAFPTWQNHVGMCWTQLRTTLSRWPWLRCFFSARSTLQTSWFVHCICMEAKTRTRTLFTSLQWGGGVDTIILQDCQLKRHFHHWRLTILIIENIYIPLNKKKSQSGLQGGKIK